MRYIDKFMAAFPFEGLTFDDISLVTQYADWCRFLVLSVTHLRLRVPWIVIPMRHSQTVPTVYHLIGLWR